MLKIYIIFTVSAFYLVTSVKVKVKVRTLDIAPLRGTPPQKRSGTDHTVLPVCVDVLIILELYKKSMTFSTLVGMFYTCFICYMITKTGLP